MTAEGITAPLLDGNGERSPFSRGGHTHTHILVFDRSAAESALYANDIEALTHRHQDPGTTYMELDFLIGPP